MGKSLIYQAFQGNPGAIRPPIFPIPRLARWVGMPNFDLLNDLNAHIADIPIWLA